MNQRSLIRAALGGAFVFFFVWGVSVQAREWALSVGGNYSEPANWSPQDVPDQITETARFGDAGSSYAVTLPAGASIDVGALIVETAEVQLSTISSFDEAFLNVAGDLILESGGLELANSIALSDSHLTVSNHLVLDTGALKVGKGWSLASDETLVNNLVAGETRFSLLDGAVASLGDTTVGSNTAGLGKARLDIASGAEVTAGDLTIGRFSSGGQEAEISISNATLRQTDAATFFLGDVAGGSAILAVSSAGAFETGTGGALIAATGEVISSGGTLTFQGDLTINGGKLREIPSSGAQRSFAPYSRIELSEGGAMELGDADLLLDDGRALAILDEASYIHLRGGVAFSTDSTLSLAFADTAPPISAAFTAEGTATLAGALILAFDAPANLSLGDSFPILTAEEGISGAFDSVTGPHPGTGLGWDLQVQGSTLFAEVGERLAGDFNNDGAVDAADFTTWRDGMESSHYSEADYQVWRSHFGTQSPSPANSIPIPSPSARFLSALAIGLFLAPPLKLRRSASRC